MKKYSLVFFIFLSFFAQSKDVFYELNIDYKKVNFAGKDVTAMAINNSIPAPKLEFTEGDVAKIKVINHTDNEASIHWHGLLLPQEQDGVPYVTYFPIKAGESFEYEFELKHAGTYWYHSHTKIDEQRGQYGSIVVHPKNGYTQEFDHDVVVQLSDWTNEDPYDVLKNLKKDGDWYKYKKDSVVSLEGYLNNSNLTAWAKNRWNRMEGMDVSDVGYDAYLANGYKSLTLLPSAKSGDKVRVRLINSGASTIFDIQQQSGAFNIISADGLDVQPTKVKEFIISMAETYDFIVTIPESNSYEFAANNIDGTGGVKVKIGTGKSIKSPDPIKPNLFAEMNHTNHNDHQMMEKPKDSNMDNHHNHHNHMEMMKPKISDKLDYKMLKTTHPVKYEGEIQDFTLELTGDMESYNWSFNNKALSESDVIKIDRGKVVRFNFVNKSMMNHPLHLHGHFFKVISGNGDFDVLKHTVNVPPMGNVTIEFEANEEKDWLFHCHNLYHAKTGMARVIRYSDYNGNKAFEKAKMKSNAIMDDDWYFRFDLDLNTNNIKGNYRYSNSKNIIEIDSERHFQGHSEIELKYSYKMSRWFNYFASTRFENSENEITIGLQYVMPFNIETSVWLNTDNNIHAKIETEFQLTNSTNFSIETSTESEWEFELEYRTSPTWAIKLNHNNISDFGIGFNLTF